MLTKERRNSIQNKLNDITGDKTYIVTFNESKYYKVGGISESNCELEIKKDSILIFRIQFSPFYDTCGVVTCHNYHITLDYIEIVKEFFEYYCEELLHKCALIGAIVTANYTEASFSSDMQRINYNDKARKLKAIGFEIIDWYNNPAHVRTPRKGYHWIQGLWIKKLDKFDVGLTKEEMNNFKSAV